MQDITQYVLDYELLESLKGKTFHYYKCDPFYVINSVTSVVGLSIGEENYLLENKLEQINYFEDIDRYALWSIAPCEPEDIHSVYSDVVQKVTEVEEKITGITVVNEHQQLHIDEEDEIDELWVTRALIFHLETKDICFEKDYISFRPEIYIITGTNLNQRYPVTNGFFLESWDDEIEPKVYQELKEI